MNTGNPILEEQARVAGAYTDRNPHARKILESIEEKQASNELYRQWEKEYN